MTTQLDAWVAQARDWGASDLHLEPGYPLALRIRGKLEIQGEPVAPALLRKEIQSLLGPDAWNHFLERRSADLSRTISGVRCRLNVLQSARGVGLALRLLASSQATLDNLNLHPQLAKLVDKPHGLILIAGPTGSGKSSTIAALLQEVNTTRPSHIITIEHPIEYALQPRYAFIRQREVGRDTPSFDQALLDAMREDPDILVVGEMRDPQTMRLTLNAAETGHLVLSTIHASSGAEALQRMVSAFPAEIQQGVAAQLADALVAVVTQRLQYRRDLDLRVPECEILIASNAVRASVRQQQFFKLNSFLETGKQEGMWTFARYRTWLDQRQRWSIPPQGPRTTEVRVGQKPKPIRTLQQTDAVQQLPPLKQPVPPTPDVAPQRRPRPVQPSNASANPNDVLVLEAHDDDLEAIISQLKKR